MSHCVFTETQRFKSLWIWTILIGVIGITSWALFFTDPSKPTEGWSMAIPLGILLFVFVLFINLKLKIRIDPVSLSYSYYPIIKERKYRFENIESLELIEYNGLLEYGGWGIKWNLDSWSYTTGGKHGIMVKTNGKKFLLGTHEPQEAQKAIAEFHKFKSASHVR